MDSWSTSWTVVAWRAECTRRSPLRGDRSPQIHGRRPRCHYISRRVGQRSLRHAVRLISIDAARVGGRVTTNGDIYVGADTHIDGGILVQKRNVVGLSLFELKLGIPIGRSTPPRVVIGPRATVAGVLRFKRKVELLVSESATIGPVDGATPVMFATDEPPPAIKN